MSREEIEYNEILAEDLIRWENASTEVAHEWRAVYDGDHFVGPVSEGFGKHYLLDRPKPAVVLPDKPTLGWLSVGDADPRLGHWQQYESAFGGNDYAIQSRVEFHDTFVTAFTPATAVPTEALDKLRDYASYLDGNLPSLRRIDNFLADVDAAGGAS